MRVTAGNVVLAWDRADAILHVRLVDARANSSHDEMVLSVPEISIALDADALLHGEVSPTEIHVLRPDLKVVRPAENRSERELSESGNSAGSAISDLMSLLADMSDATSPGRGLRQIRIAQGSLDVEDRRTGISWRGTLENTRVWRDAPGLHAASFLAAASDGRQSDLAIAAQYDAKKKKLSAGLNFSQIRPAMFAAFGSSLRNLAAVDLPVRGSVGLAVGGDGAVEKIDFDFLGGAGHLALPVPLAQELGMLAAAQRLAVRGGQLSGTYTNDGAVMDIDRLSIDAEPGQTVHLPAPLDHDMPLSAIRAEGYYRGDDKTAKVESLEVDLDGPSIALSATAEGIGTAGGSKAKVEIVAKDIETNDFPRYWPSALGTSAYEWCTEHLSEGGISEARIEVSATAGADGVEIASLAGTMNMSGITVDYLPPMPKAQNVVRRRRVRSQQPHRENLRRRSRRRVGPGRHREAVRF